MVAFPACIESTDKEIEGKEITLSICPATGTVLNLSYKKLVLFYFIFLVLAIPTLLGKPHLSEPVHLLFLFDSFTSTL